MENNALCYFYITFRGFLSVHIFFLNNKNPQVIFLVTVKAQKWKPQGELWASASAPHS